MKLKKSADTSQSTSPLCRSVPALGFPWPQQPALSVLSGRSYAALLSDLVSFCCFVMSCWLEAVWLSDEEQRLNERASGWPGLENRISHTRTHTRMHPHTTPRYRCLTLEHKNSAVLTQSTPSPPPPSQSFISLSLHLIYRRTASGCVQIRSL